MPDLDPPAGVPFLRRILARERAIVLGGVVVLAGLAWLETWRHARSMAMTGAMPPAMSWGLAGLGAASAMWAVMMAAMMLPSATPMLLLFANLEGKHRALGRPATPGGVFAAGYLAVWLAWSALAATVQWMLQGLLLLSPHLAATSAALSAGFLILAGVYQFTPWKEACLAHCQSPLGFLLARWRDGRWGAFRMGAHHGAYCAGCCWALMGLLFVGGVMNLLWVAALAALVLVEKVVARGPWVSRLTGVGLAGWGMHVLWSGVMR